MAAPRSKRKPPARRRSGEGSWNQRADGSWRLRIPIGTAADGGAILKDFYGREREEALLKMQEYRAANPNGPPSASAKQTLTEFMLTWLETVIQPTNALNTLESYTKTFALHIAPILGDTPICDLSAPQVQAWLNDLSAKGIGRTVAYAHSILRAALNQAVAWDILSKNVATKVKVPTYTPRAATALTVQQAQSLVAAAGGRLDVRKPLMRKNKRSMKRIAINPRLEVLYLLALACGLRRGELIALRWSGVDWEAQTLTVSASIDKRRRAGTTKGRRARTVSINGLVAALQGHRTRMQAEDHREGWKPDGFIFPTAVGTSLSPRNLDKHFKSVLEAAGLPDVRFHDLRHSAGSIMLAAGSMLTDVSHILGHGSPVITGRVYAHSYEDSRKKAAQSISELLQPEKPDGVRLG